MDSTMHWFGFEFSAKNFREKHKNKLWYKGSILNLIQQFIMNSEQ